MDHDQFNFCQRHQTVKCVHICICISITCESPPKVMYGDQQKAWCKQFDSVPKKTWLRALTIQR